MKRHHEFVCIGGGGGWSMSRCVHCGEEVFGAGWGTRLMAWLLPRWFGCDRTAFP